MGQRGPAGKRSEERRRRNKDGPEVITVDFTAVAGHVVEVPAPDEDWHPVAYDWYMSLTKSLQSRFFEPSDWSTAYMLADQITLELEPRPVQTGTDAEGNPEYEIRRVPMPGAKLNSILKGMTSLLTTESDRRRLSIETQRNVTEDGESATVTDITADRRDLMG